MISATRAQQILGSDFIPPGEMKEEVSIRLGISSAKLFFDVPYSEEQLENQKGKVILVPKVEGIKLVDLHKCYSEYFATPPYAALNDRYFANKPLDGGCILLAKDPMVGSFQLPADKQEKLLSGSTHMLSACEFIYALLFSYRLCDQDLYQNIAVRCSDKDAFNESPVVNNTSLGYSIDVIPLEISLPNLGIAYKVEVS